MVEAEVRITLGRLRLSLRRHAEMDHLNNDAAVAGVDGDKDGVGVGD